MGIAERIDSLAPRERQLLFILISVFVVLTVLLIPIGVSAVLSSRRDENARIQEAIDRIHAERNLVDRKKQEKEALAAKYRTPVPALAGYLSKTATQNSLEIPEIKDRPAVPHGKKFEEQSTEISMKKVGMLNFAKFLEALVQGPHPISIGKLNIRKRTSQADSYDIGMTVSSYHRIGGDDSNKAGGAQ